MTKLNRVFINQTEVSILIMVKDFQQIIQNLLTFYDFKNKIVVSVGAGGGQFIAYAKTAKHVIAIDNDASALHQLRENIIKNQLSEKFTLIHSDFSDVNVKGDVVLFEFCLHEMSNPQEKLEYGKKIAKDVIIADHGTNSKWAFIANETEKAENSWKYVLRNEIQKIRTYKASQYFKNYDELYEKIKVQGQNSIERIEKYKTDEDIEIPMEYTFAFM